MVWEAVYGLEEYERISDGTGLSKYFFLTLDRISIKTGRFLVWWTLDVGLVDRSPLQFFVLFLNLVKKNCSQHVKLGAGNMVAMDLLQLRGAMKRDPKAYEDELCLQLRHFQVKHPPLIFGFWRVSMMIHFNEDSANFLQAIENMCQNLNVYTTRNTTFVECLS